MTLSSSLAVLPLLLCSVLLLTETAFDCLLLLLLLVSRLLVFLLMSLVLLMLIVVAMISLHWLIRCLTLILTAKKTKMKTTQKLWVHRSILPDCLRYY